MGKGALPDDHPLTLGMTGFWGTKFINDKCRDADWVLALGTRFKEADSLVLGAGIHLRVSRPPSSSTSISSRARSAAIFRPKSARSPTSNRR